jgi:hypothetical protein
MSAAAVDQTLQRSQILGATESGNKLLVFKSHFGPSSRAPHTQLQILVPGTSVPVLEDGRYAFQGDECTIIQFNNDLLNAHMKRIQYEEMSWVEFDLCDRRSWQSAVWYPNPTSYPPALGRGKFGTCFCIL